MYSLWNNIFDPFPLIGKPSVVVVSDTQLAEFKRQNTEAEIAELQKLVDSHKQSIDRLTVTIEKLQATLPQPAAE